MWRWLKLKACCVQNVRIQENAYHAENNCSDICLFFSFSDINWQECTEKPSWRGCRGHLELGFSFTVCNYVQNNCSDFVCPHVHTYDIQFSLTGSTSPVLKCMYVNVFLGQT